MNSSPTTHSQLRPHRARRARPTSLRRQLSWSPTLVAHGAGESLSLAPCGSGWQLVADGGRVVYGADGRSARHECLRRAYEAGVLYVR